VERALKSSRGQIKVLTLEGLKKITELKYDHSCDSAHDENQ
jgi:hypothetical protein